MAGADDLWMSDPAYLALLRSLQFERAQAPSAADYESRVNADRDMALARIAEQYTQARVGHDAAATARGTARSSARQEADARYRRDQAYSGDTTTSAAMNQILDFRDQQRRAEQARQFQLGEGQIAARLRNYQPNLGTPPPAAPDAGQYNYLDREHLAQAPAQPGSGGYNYLDREHTAQAPAGAYVVPNQPVIQPYQPPPNTTTGTTSPMQTVLNARRQKPDYLMRAGRAY